MAVCHAYRLSSVEPIWLKTLSQKPSLSRLQPCCRRLDGELIRSLLSQANWGPSEDVGNRDQGRPGTRL